MEVCVRSRAALAGAGCPGPSRGNRRHRGLGESRERAVHDPGVYPSKGTAVDRLPTGTVTFLFTDIEGSTQLLQHLGDHYATLLAEYRHLIRTEVQRQGGAEVDHPGDAFFFSFPRAQSALVASIAAQRALLAHTWPDGIALGVRMGLHTGEPRPADPGYVGMDVHRAARICHAGHGGQILLSNTTRILVEEGLPAEVTLRDLGMHRLKDLSHPTHLFQVMAGGLPADFPPVRSLAARPNNLPLQLTSFVDRDREVTEVNELLPRASLLTLTGVGGCGKTRLALQVAAEALEAFTDGAWLVELAAVGDPALVAQTAASALRVREQPSRELLETLVDYLRPKQLLLVVDNCEHLLTACAHFAHTLLRQCPDVRVLTTSREGLGVGGETLYPLMPLAVPALHAPQSAEVLLHYDAVRLFVERAVARVPTFALTDQHTQSVARICRRLDGLPLAIEMAAARINVMSVEQIEARLIDRFQFLRGRDPTAPPRQQTLRATFDWSYDLLSDPDRVLLRRLAVFAGGFALGAAEAVCSGNGLEQAEVLDLVSSLVDQSWVIADPHPGEVRYRLLETVQHYGEERLQTSGESARTQDRHLEHFLAFAERADVQLQGAGQQVWLERLEADRDNLRAALGRSQEAGQVEETMRLAGALVNFWSLRGQWSEGRRWLEGTLSEGHRASEAARAKVLYGAGYLAWRQGDFARAAALSEDSRTLYSRLGDKQGLAYALLTLGLVARSQNEYAHAEALHEESLALFRELDHRRGILWSLGLLGIVLWYRGNYARAAAMFEECLVLAHAQEYKGGIAAALHGLGRVAAYEGADARATALLEDGLALFQELGDQEGIASSLQILGRVALYRKDYEPARALLGESLTLFRQLEHPWVVVGLLAALAHVAVGEGNAQQAEALLVESMGVRKRLGYDWDKWGLAEGLEALAAVATAQGRSERAVRLLGAAESVRTAISAPLPPIDQLEHNRQLATLRGRFHDDAFGALWAQGKEMPLEQVIAQALGP